MVCNKEWCELCELQFDLGLERCLKSGQAEGGGEAVTAEGTI